MHHPDHGRKGHILTDHEVINEEIARIVGLLTSVQYDP